jgi:ABC-type nitrate/sulfonate/bicarbonate transport system permease component
MVGAFEVLRRSSTSIGAVFGFLLLWQVAVMLFQVPTWLLPTPSAIWVEFTKQAHLLGRHIWATGVGAVGGLIIGSLSGSGATCSRPTASSMPRSISMPRSGTISAEH